MAYPAPVYPDNYSKKTQVQFGGYNHSRSAGDMEWFDTKGMTSDYAPLLASRAPEFHVRGFENVQGMIGGDELFVIEDDRLLKKNHGESGFQEVALQLIPSGGARLMAILGKRLVIWPDKVFLDTETGEAGNLAVLFIGAAVFFSGTYEGEDAAANCIYLSSGAKDFRVNDAVSISGDSVHPENNISVVVREVEIYNETTGEGVLHFYDNTFHFNDGETVQVPQKGGTTVEKPGYSASVTIDRIPPELDILFSHENRLWGAKGDTIYASANGDPFNWYNYDLTGLESWTVDVLDEGDFTGGCSYLGYPVFFKDNHIYKIYGSIPSEYRVVPSADLGVEPGSGASLAIAGEKLFYLSRAGVMMYTGALPQIISGPLGDVKYHNAVGGSDGIKYYISMTDTEGSSSRFVYDTRNGIWHRDSNEPFSHCAWHENGLYTVYANKAMHFIGAEGDAPGGSAAQRVLWHIESADFTEASPQRKWLDGIEIRAELAEGAFFKVYVKYSNDMDWELKGGPYNTPGKRSYIIPNIPRRADFYKIRIAGGGRIWIYSIAPSTEQGSSWHGTNGG